jgi:hypothetical protein
VRRFVSFHSCARAGISSRSSACCGACAVGYGDCPQRLQTAYYAAAKIVVLLANCCLVLCCIGCKTVLFLMAQTLLSHTPTLTNPSSIVSQKCTFSAPLPLGLPKAALTTPAGRPPRSSSARGSYSGTPPAAAPQLPLLNLTLPDPLSRSSSALPPRSPAPVPRVRTRSSTSSSDLTPLSSPTALDVSGPDNSTDTAAERSKTGGKTQTRPAAKTSKSSGSHKKNLSADDKSWLTARLRPSVAALPRGLAWQRRNDNCRASDAG